MTSISATSSAVGAERAVASPAFAVRADLGLLSVTGGDATSFLQGQLTADVAALDPGRWTWAGWCNPKGRLVAVVRLGRLADGFVLQLPSAQAEAIATRLRRFVLRAKVAIAASTPPCLWIRGATLAAAIDPSIAALPPDARVVLGSADAPIFVTPQAVLAHLDPTRIAALRPAFAAASELPGAAVDALEIDAGIPWLTAGTEEAFIPQMLDLDLDVVGGVSFSKGCYPGQEIVARTRYLGTVKRRLHRLRLSASAAPGDPILPAGADDQAVGTILRTAPSGDGCVALAVLDLAAAGDPLRTTDGAVADVRAVHPDAA